jgi:glucose/arabinose dehydrogenase
MCSARLVSAFAIVGFAEVAGAQGPLSVNLYASGLTQPLAFIQDPLSTTSFFAVQKNGLVRRVSNGVVTNTVMDLGGSISFGANDEQGLLGLAFAPNHASTGHFYTYFTDTAGNIQVARFTRSGDTASLATRFNILNIGHPGQNNHNGATPLFGPDGYLYLGIGDGGGSNDPNNNAQNPNSLLGKMLRIDPSVDDFPGDANRNYGIPTSNPFFGSNGPIQAVDEIWAFGVRNPYKFTFDRANGAMVMADVGQDAWEEINYEPANAGARNYGWHAREGMHDTGFGGAAYAPLTDPIFEYAHGAGASITGGIVYRGSALQGYQGRYFFADFIKRQVWSLGLNVNPVTGEATAGSLIEHTAQFGGSNFLGNIASIDQGADGELYLSSFNGNVYRVVPEPASLAALGFGALLLLRKRRR